MPNAKHRNPRNYIRWWEKESPEMPIHHTIGRLDASIVWLVIYFLFVHVLAEFLYIWSWKIEMVHSICMYNLRALFYFWLCGRALFFSDRFFSVIAIECSVFFSLLWASCFDATLAHLYNIHVQNVYRVTVIQGLCVCMCNILHLHNVILHFIPTGSQFLALCARKMHDCMHFAESAASSPIVWWIKRENDSTMHIFRFIFIFCCTSTLPSVSLFSLLCAISCAPVF